MIIDCIGCLHGFRPNLEGGDLLIVTGDLNKSDKIDQYSDFFSWFACQNYSYKVMIAGNHDTEIFHGLDFSFPDERIYYLEDFAVEIEGLKIWGTPWSHRFIGINPKCCAFTYFDETWFYDEKVSKIPHDTDIIITHAPAFGILDGIPIEVKRC
jgi:Calcineurin-like phosphoesterase